MDYPDTFTAEQIAEAEEERLAAMLDAYYEDRAVEDSRGLD